MEYLNWWNVFIFAFVFLFCPNFFFQEKRLTRKWEDVIEVRILYKKLSSCITRTSVLITICSLTNIFTCIWLVLSHLMTKYAWAKTGEYLAIFLKWYYPIFKSCIQSGEILPLKLFQGGIVLFYGYTSRDKQNDKSCNILSSFWKKKKKRNDFFCAHTSGRATEGKLEGPT